MTLAQHSDPLKQPLAFGNVAQIKALKALRAQAEIEEAAEKEGGGWYWVEIEVSIREKVFFDKKPSICDLDIDDYMDGADITFTKVKPSSN